jgi:uncharacterized FAD-dependent dehydrogenase
MKQEVDIQVRPNEVNSAELIRTRISDKVTLAADDISDWHILRRSIDARGRKPVVRMRVAVYSKGEKHQAPPALLEQFQMVTDAPAVTIVGAGPTGYFAALECIERGFRPVVYDRGKDVRSRRRDLRAIQQEGKVNPHSNYCFGEGGAGTYSDGKLYTRSHKRGTIEKAMRLLVEHGAPPDILVDAHPHIGSNKLPKIVAAIRETIERFGGEVHFNTHITDLVIDEGKVVGIKTADGREIPVGALVLATGHSARDVYRMLDRQQVRLESKPFALGVRIEHPQALIDRIQYNQSPREESLPAASYKLVTQVKDRGVFSFCMCPGGLIVPASTAPGEIVVNGMSMSRRDSAYANSGTVVAVELDDLKPYADHGVFAGIALQEQVERAMFSFSDGTQRAPAQRLIDFVTGRESTDLPKSSYIPGLIPAPLHTLLPKGIYNRLRQGILDFADKMKGYYTNEAVVVGTESRTSSPIRIPRDRETYQHPDIAGLFPAGEGAGYAGGIISAAMDGQNVARAVAQFMITNGLASVHS